MRIYSFRYLFLGLAVLFLGIFTHSSVSYASNLICPQAMNTNVPLDECEAVVALYDSTDGQNRFINTNRDADTDICTWYGVTCMNI